MSMTRKFELACLNSEASKKSSTKFHIYNNQLLEDLRTLINQASRNVQKWHTFKSRFNHQFRLSNNEAALGYLAFSVGTITGTPEVAMKSSETRILLLEYYKRIQFSLETLSFLLILFTF